MFGINQLGAVAGSVSPGGNAEWNAYFSSLRKHVNAKWTSAVGSYNTLKAVRTTLSLPFIVGPGGEGGSGVGAWSNDLEQQAVNVHGMVVLITSALDDVVSGKRKVATNEAGGGWVIESLPSDVLRLEVKAPGIPTLVNAQTGAPENIQGTVSAIWALAVAGAVVTAGAIYLAVRAIDSLDSMMKEKTTQTIAKRNGELIQSGKATAPEVAALTKAEGQAAADLAKARAEEKNAGDGPEKWSPLVKTLVWGGVAIGALIIAAKLIPSRSGGLAANPIKLSSNPINKPKRLHGVLVRADHDNGYYVLGERDNEYGDYAILGTVRPLHTKTRGTLWEWSQRGSFEGGETSTLKNAILLAAGKRGRKFSLTRVNLNRGGYTSRGQYFGIGQPLFKYEDEDGLKHGYLRASSRADAKAQLRSKYDARFHNPLGMRAINSLSPMMLASLA